MWRCDKAHDCDIWPRCGWFGLIDLVPSDYRLSRPLAARTMGVLLAAVGVVVLLLTVAVALLDLPAWTLGTGLLAAAMLVGAAAVLVSRRTVVVRLDETGYRVRLVRGAGATEARWTDVEDVVTATVTGERCVVLRLRDGRRTTIPVRMLAGSPDAFVDDLRRHLDRGRGYRRIN
jgi:hypothetical protein